VVQLEARCDPEDIIANRLDPWHGVHFHPYAFASLTVLDPDDDVLKVRVAKRLIGRIVAETDATFHSPEPRSIVMTIVEGEGKGSVVETHATPVEPGRTMVVEATLATSDRKGFRHARRLQPFIRPFMERSARRLWVDDAAYAERLYELRNRSEG
jgi:isorenieratene synthase